MVVVSYGLMIAGASRGLEAALRMRARPGQLSVLRAILAAGAGDLRAFKRKEWGLPRRPRGRRAGAARTSRSARKPSPRPGNKTRSNGAARPARRRGGR